MTLTLSFNSKPYNVHLAITAWTKNEVNLVENILKEDVQSWTFKSISHANI